MSCERRYFRGTELLYCLVNILSVKGGFRLRVVVEKIFRSQYQVDRGYGRGQNSPLKGVEYEKTGLIGTRTSGGAGSSAVLKNSRA